jgi:DNA-binding CsgD family transcriptional regulator
MGLGNRQIARDLQLSVKTIQTYREHIKEKLGVANARELLQLAIQWEHSDPLN